MVFNTRIVPADRGGNKYRGCLMYDSARDWSFMVAWDKLFNQVKDYQDAFIKSSIVKGKYYVGTPNGGIFYEGTRDEIARLLCKPEE
jgi:hypothetical protein